MRILAIQVSGWNTARQQIYAHGFVFKLYVRFECLFYSLVVRV